VHKTQLSAGSVGRIAKLVATVVGVAAVAIPIIIVAMSSAARSPAPSSGVASHSTSAAGAATTASNQADTTKAVQDLLRTLILPPGARPAATAPVPELGYLGTPSLGSIQDRGYWTLPQPMNEALDFFNNNIPSGLTKSGTETRSLRGVVVLRGLQVDATPTAAYSNLGFMLRIAADGTGSAIRVDARGRALPARPAAEHIPLPVSSVEITATRSSPTTQQPPAVHRIVVGDQAQKLATIVNGSRPYRRVCLRQGLLLVATRGLSSRQRARWSPSK
jgi:hypothetical protein